MRLRDIRKAPVGSLKEDSKGAVKAEVRRGCTPREEEAVQPELHKEDSRVGCSSEELQEGEEMYQEEEGSYQEYLEDLLAEEVRTGNKTDEVVERSSCCTARRCHTGCTMAEGQEQGRSPGEGQ